MTPEQHQHRQFVQLVVFTTEDLRRHNGFEGKWRPFFSNFRIKHNGTEETRVRHIPRTSVWLGEDGWLYQMCSRRMGSPDFFRWHEDEATPSEVERIAAGLGHLRIH